MCHISGTKVADEYLSYSMIHISWEINCDSCKLIPRHIYDSFLIKNNLSGIKIDTSVAFPLKGHRAL